MLAAAHGASLPFHGARLLDDWWDQALAAWLQPLSPLRPFNLAAVSLTVCPLPATNTVDYTNPFASNPLLPLQSQRWHRPAKLWDLPRMPQVLSAATAQAPDQIFR